MPRWQRSIASCLCFTTISLAALGLTACIKPTIDVPKLIGPYHELSGRLLVITPEGRWQVAIDYRSNTPAKGYLRLTHAASSRIIELRWQQENMEMRDNGHSPAWSQISHAQLSEHGIVLKPVELATFLQGDIPAGFRSKGGGIWERHQQSSNGKHLIRVTWQPEGRRLIVSDIPQGKTATLIISEGK